MGRDVIIACDFNSGKETYEFLDLFNEKDPNWNSLNREKPFVKIGMELFYSEGPDIVREIKSRGHKIFLDLKCHDIPNTVKKTMTVLAGLGVDICNVHAAGTVAMMKAAIEGLTEGSSNLTSDNKDIKRPLLIAVTQLTSTDEKTMRDELLIDAGMEEVVSHYGLMARKSGLDGVVCSPHEVAKIHDICGRDFLTVTPGIRPRKIETENIGDDQKRIMTPKEAKVAGSDYIVVGRPIVQSTDPVSSYRECIFDFVD